MSESTFLVKGIDVNKSAADQSLVVKRGDFEILRGCLVGKLFRLVSAYARNVGQFNVLAFDEPKLLKVHSVYGHLNFRSCCKLLDMEEGPFPVCSSCALANLPRTNIPKTSITRASRPLYRLFADLSGRKRATLAGYRYYMLIVDDFSRFKWVRWLKLKSDALTEFKTLVVSLKAQCPSYAIAYLRSDGGGEFISKAFKTFLASEGIQSEVSAPYSQFQNGVVERGIGIINSGARAMLEHADSPLYDWHFAVCYNVYIRNNIPAVSEEDSPYVIFHGVKRDTKIQFVGIFGCLGYAKVFVRSKQEPKARRVVFLGYSDQYKAAMVRDISVERSRLSEYYSRDIKIDTSQFPYKNVLVPRPVSPPLDREDLKEIDQLDSKVEEHDVIDHIVDSPVQLEETTLSDEVECASDHDDSVDLEVDTSSSITESKSDSHNIVYLTWSLQ